MCGIVGYVGQQDAVPLLLDGLARLEYRGYDSAGIAVIAGDQAKVHKKAGRVRDLRSSLPERLAGATGIGHTRWATHGLASDANAHPHRSFDGHICVVHNGIIDNAAALRAELSAAAIEPVSDTDSEVLAHLIAKSTADTLEGAVLEAVNRIEGTYGLAVLDERHPERVVLARSGSPLTPIFTQRINPQFRVGHANW